MFLRTPAGVTFTDVYEVEATGEMVYCHAGRTVDTGRDHYAARRLPACGSRPSVLAAEVGR